MARAWARGAPRASAGCRRRHRSAAARTRLYAGRSPNDDYDEDEDDGDDFDIEESYIAAALEVDLAGLGETDDDELSLPVVDDEE